MTRSSLFGVALAHSPRRFEETLEAAAVADELGADLLTLADHPYSPRELETWTMLTTLAAHTERVKLASNVVNLGLRPPAMLAKSAATLQFVSGGRFVLGIGSGQRDGTVAFGGRERSPGDSVAALDEGLGLIRRLWDPESAVVDHQGRFFQLSGARFGPKPDPEIPVWIGAFGPKMLALTGRRGDGWIPSNAYLDLDDVSQMQRLIDAGARSAGRDPAAIRRVFNVFGAITDVGPTENGRHLAGPVDFWVEALRDYRDRLGFDSFIHWPSSDHADQARRFLEGVRPRLLEDPGRLRDSRSTEPVGQSSSPRTSRSLRANASGWPA